MYTTSQHLSAVSYRSGTNNNPYLSVVSYTVQVRTTNQYLSVASYTVQVRITNQYLLVVSYTVQVRTTDNTCQCVLETINSSRIINCITKAYCVIVSCPCTWHITRDKPSYIMQFVHNRKAVSTSLSLCFNTPNPYIRLQAGNPIGVTSDSLLAAISSGIMDGT